MVRIDEELLRKRAEHNDGELTSLVEITLHQYDIEKIENLDVYCRNLEILFLQCNQISKIENLHKLKKLRYLQLALNNITVIENLGRCESLEKLDLTVNFVDDLLCIESLVSNVHLKQLFLVGNPCTEKAGYRDYIITVLPQLIQLDGHDITKSERIIARQLFDEIRARFVQERLDRGEDPPAPIELAPVEPLDDEDDTPEAIKRREEELERKRKEFQTVKVGHSPTARLQAARAMAAFKETKDVKPKPVPKPAPVLYAADGRVLQKNEGKWDFQWTENASTLVLTVQLSKFLDSSLMDVQAFGNFIRVTVKGKILQLTFDVAVDPKSILCERSKLSGVLAITMLKMSSGPLISEKVGLEDIRRDERIKAQELERLAQKEARVLKEKAMMRNKRNERLGDVAPGAEPITYKNIVDEKKITKLVKSGIQDSRFIESDFIKKQEVDFVDDPDVPPLC